MSAAALPFAAMALQAGGQLIGGLSANSAAKREAAMLEENGRLSVLSGEQDSSAVRHDERMAAGEAIAGMASGGGGLGSGSIVDILESSARNRERDIAGLRSRAVQEQRNYQSQAKGARAQGKAALISAAFGAAATAIGGAAQIKAGRINKTTVANERSAQLSAGKRNVGYRGG